MTYTWHSVTKNIHAENLGLKFNRKLDKIKKHVVHFPQDSVHLNISLEKNPKKDLYTARLTLHVPSNVLHSEKMAENMMTAFDDAADALVREIESLKADLSGAARWERKERRSGLQQQKAARFAGQPSMEEESSSLPESLVEMLAEHRPNLLEHTRRKIRSAELEQKIPAGEITPEEIVGEVERKVLLAPEDKPPEENFKTWFLKLARKAVEQRSQLAVAK